MMGAALPMVRMRPAPPPPVPRDQRPPDAVPDQQYSDSEISLLLAVKYGHMHPSMPTIVTSTLAHVGMSKAKFEAGGRKKPVVYARRIMMHLGRKYTKLSYQMLARGTCITDHTTVVYSNKKTTAALAAGDEKLRTDIAAVERDMRRRHFRKLMMGG